MYCLKRACRWVFCEKLINLLHDYEAGHNIICSLIHNYISGILSRGHFLGLGYGMENLQQLKHFYSGRFNSWYHATWRKRKTYFGLVWFALVYAGLRWLELFSTYLHCVVLLRLSLSGLPVAIARYVSQ